MPNVTFWLDAPIGLELWDDVVHWIVVEQEKLVSLLEVRAGYEEGPYGP